MYARLIKGKTYRLKGFRFVNTGNPLADFRRVDRETAECLEEMRDRFEVLKVIPAEYFDDREARSPVILRLDTSKLRYWQAGKYRWAPDKPTNQVPFGLALQLIKTGNFLSADSRLHRCIFKDQDGGLHLEWRGIVNPHDGYGLSSIRFIENLARAGVKLSCYPHGYHVAQGEGETVSRLLRADIKENCKWGILYGQPPGFDDMKTRHRIGFTMFETDDIPDLWNAQCNAMDRIWVPSQFCKEVFERCGVTVPIDVIPLGYEDRIFTYKPHRQTKTFTFFIAANLSERKNARAALRAFREVFAAGEKVRFVVWPGIFAHLGTDEGDLKEFEADPRIEIKRFNYSSEDFREQLWKTDCFVFPTHGEGFGIPPVEAMACGTPVIVTDWSGCREYADSRYNYPLRVSGLSKSESLPDYYRGQWAEPDFEHLKALMLHVYRHREEAMKKAKAGALWIKKFAARNIVPLMIAALERADRELGVSGVGADNQELGGSGEKTADQEIGVPGDVSEGIVEERESE